MSGGWPWSELDIAPTGDRRAIRTAYSRRLKAIDVEADKQGFIALREAYDQALQLAEQFVDEPKQDFGLGDSITALDRVPLLAMAGDERWAEPAAPVEEPVLASEPMADPEVEAARAHAHAMAQLLFQLNDPEDPLHGTDHNAALFAHWEGMRADPRLETVEGHGDAELWIAHLLAETCPASDPLVEPVSDYFGWAAGEGTIEQAPAIAFLMQRRRGLEFYEAVQRDNHALHGAWRELTKPATEKSRRGWVSRKKVQTLLATVRRDYPMLEGCFDSYRVALWENGSGQGLSFRWAVPVIWGLIMLARCASSMTGPAPVPPESPVPVVANDPLSDPRTDIDTALAKNGMEGLTLNIAQARNPALAKAMNAAWQAAVRDSVSQASFAKDLQLLLNDWRTNAVLGDPALLRADRRLRLDRADTLAGLPEQCNRFLLGAIPFPAGLSPVKPEVERTLTLRALLAGDGTPRKRPETAPIPAPVFDAALGASNLKQARFDAAIKGDGATDAEGCAARRALLRAALNRTEPDVVPLLKLL